MSAVLLDGKAVAKEIRVRVAERVRRLGRRPELRVVLIGGDAASAVYVRNKERAAAEVGLGSEVIRLPADVRHADALEVVEALSRDEAVDGVLIQSPVPPQVDFEELVAALDPVKDVDGFHPINLGRLIRGLPGRVACTPRGIMTLLAWYGIELRGRRATVVGRSVIVGKPMALLLLSADATVSVVHSRTPDLAAVTTEADVLIVAAGRPWLIAPEAVKPGAVVVDVGMNRMADGTLTGDVDPRIREVAGWLAPVPGGVGPMTVATLLENTVDAAEQRC